MLTSCLPTISSYWSPFPTGMQLGKRAEALPARGASKGLLEAGLQLVHLTITPLPLTELH